MARNVEVTRQWQVLRDIDAARTGITIPKLAAARGVHQRTIRRDLDALASAGFPLYDEKVNGTTMWKLRARPFRGIEEMGLSLMELCTLYFSRAMLEAWPGRRSRTMRSGRSRRSGGRCRKAAGGFSTVCLAIKAKAAGRKKQDDDRKVRDIVRRATEAMLGHRRVATSIYAELEAARAAYVGHHFSMLRMTRPMTPAHPFRASAAS